MFPLLIEGEGSQKGKVCKNVGLRGGASPPPPIREKKHLLEMFPSGGRQKNVYFTVRLTIRDPY